MAYVLIMFKIFAWITCKSQQIHWVKKIIIGLHENEYMKKADGTAHKHWPSFTLLF